MQLVDSPDDLGIIDSIVCIGNFDGVHIGHQMLLRAMQQEAEKHARPSIILTFFPPAKLFFNGGKYLSSAAEKLELLKAFSPDAVVIIPFNQDYALTPSSVFVEQIARLKPHTLIVGEDFRFGHQREGSLNDLSKVSGRLEVFNLKHLGEAPVSSTRIRQLLQAGNVEAVSKLLGRFYSADGLVIQGDKRGRQIGFPTANIQTDSNKALPLGVFAVTSTVKGRVIKGMANVGPRPSFPDEPPSLEAHFFDFAETIYGESLTVNFRSLLRRQLTFANLDALKAQLKQDKANALAALQP